MSMASRVILVFLLSAGTVQAKAASCVCEAAYPATASVECPEVWKNVSCSGRNEGSQIVAACMNDDTRDSVEGYASTPSGRGDEKLFCHLTY